MVIVAHLHIQNITIKNTFIVLLYFNLTPRLCFYWLLERERKRKHRFIDTCIRTLTGDRTHNRGMCPDLDRTAIFWCTGSYSKQLKHLARTELVLKGVHFKYDL